ncbi:VIT domain-containing protein [Actinosynnema sp. NPDC050436]|uniref:VIT domain-containing protein n=1 Tax=Actinosynnema sp. NPDC050436 TaxID=3155659 RepID=UPI0033DFE07B
MTTPIEVIDAGPAAGDEGLGCLRTDRGNLPLEAVDVRAAITGLASRTTITQTFHNPHDEPLEATYIFPLPSRSAVTALRMEADDRVVDGVLKERGAARAEYDEAVSTGKRAAIAEEERPGVFTTRVGNVLPGERVTVRLTLAGVLAYEDDAATYRLPLVVAPRYVPGAPLAGGQVGAGVAADTDAVPDASRISPPVLLPGFPDPVRLLVEVEVDTAGLPAATPSASLHATVTERTEQGFRVTVEPGARVDRDFLLRLRFADEGVVRTALAVRPDETGTSGTFAVTVLPPSSDAAVRGRDVVLVLDRSGSMHGWKMVAARRAAGRIVDSLTTADRFAVLAFDNVVDTPAELPAGLVEATDRNRYRAVEFLAGLDARGGTEMLAPLRRAGELLGRPDDRERVLVLVTDGQVGDEDRLLRELAIPLSGVRVHTVGIDRAVNEAFLHRLAGSAGRCELVESEDRLDEALRGIHRRIGSPVLTGLAVLGDGVDGESLAPSPLPDLFPGVPVVVTGRYRGALAGVDLTGDGGWRQRVAAVSSDNPCLSALWARARVRDLEDRYVVGVGDLADLERRIVATSLEFGVLSRFTAFVAVDSRVVNESGEVHRVTQPVESPSGWAQPSFGGGGFATTPAAPGGAPIAPRRLRMSSDAVAMPETTGVAPQFAAAPPSFAAPVPPPAPSPAAPPPAAPKPVARKSAAPGPAAPSPAAPSPAPAAGPASGSAPSPVPSVPEALARFVARELGTLRAADRSGAAAALARLAAEITRLEPGWTAAGEPADQVRALAELAAALTRALSGSAGSGAGAAEEAEPGRLLARAVAVLEGIAAPRKRVPFWKRR